MVQSSEMSVSDTIETSKHAIDHGADGLMVLPPWLESPSERGVLYHYEQVARAVSADIVLYNTPAASGVEITPAMFRKLAAIDNVRYMKDSQGDLARIQRLAAICEGAATGRGAHVLCGVDPLAPYALMAGAEGMIWGLRQHHAPRVCAARRTPRRRSRARRARPLAHDVARQLVHVGERARRRVPAGGQDRDRDGGPSDGSGPPTPDAGGRYGPSGHRRRALQPAGQQGRPDPAGVAGLGRRAALAHGGQTVREPSHRPAGNSPERMCDDDHHRSGGPPGRLAPPPDRRRHRWAGRRRGRTVAASPPSTRRPAPS